jgi:hypothetical protein
MSALLDALGYVGDALGKPGRAVRGVLGGRLDEGLAAVPFSDSLGLTDESRKVSGTDLIGANPDSTLGQIAGMGVEMATDPLNLISGAGLLRMSGAGAAAAAAARNSKLGLVAADLAGVGKAAYGGVGRGGVADLLSNRRAFTTAVPSEAAADGWKILPRLDSAERAQDVAKTIHQMRPTEAEHAAGLVSYGGYSPPARTAVVNPGLTPSVAAETLRHESMHGMIGSRATGNGQPLSPMLEAIAASRSASTPAIRGIGQIGEEAAARYAGGGLASVREFLGRPAPLYSQQVSKDSPLLGRLLDSGKLKYLADPRAAAIEAGKLGAVTGVGAGGLYGLDQLLPRATSE